MELRDEAYLTLLRALPKGMMSSAVGAATRLPFGRSAHQLAIRLFVKAYGVNVAEASGELDDYPTFSAFFTRRLKPGARDIDRDPDALVSPVDGTVSEFGTIERGECVQAKGIRYSVAALLNDVGAARAFDGGTFLTVYLSPKDYHRIHSPMDGVIEGYSYVPGQFWPVSPALVRNKEALFAVNERLVTHLATVSGKVAVVAVGATCVARIHASYDAVVTHNGGQAASRVYDRPISVERGGELGVFEMGSTVIVLWEPGRVELDASLQLGAAVRFGQKIGRRK